MSSSAQAATWFGLESPESINGIMVEVDLESLRSRGEKRDLTTRIIYPQPQKKQDISFQSVIAELEISCINDLDFWRSISLFSNDRAEGKALSSEHFGSTGLPRSVLKMLPDKAWATLQRSACGRAETTSP
jgi:hypothetical protein